MEARSTFEVLCFDYCRDMYTCVCDRTALDFAEDEEGREMNSSWMVELPGLL
jgi:hypothetical protein